MNNRKVTFLSKFICLCLFISLDVNANNLVVGVKNINVDDSIFIILQQSAEIQKKVNG